MKSIISTVVPRVASLVNSHTLATCFVFILMPLIFFGCRQPAMTPVHFPITTGFHDALPERGTRIAVEGTNPLAVNHVMQWLQDHGYKAVPPNPMEPMTSNLLVTVTTTMEPAIRGGMTPAESSPVTVAIRVV
jgi:hypothetical protein